METERNMMEKRMRELTNQLNEANRVYYNSGEEILSNKDYDDLYDELVLLEKETGIRFEDSPTQKAGYKVEGNLPEVVHEYPMLSLDKTKDIMEFVKTFGVRDSMAIVMWKMDGSTIVATYEKGMLTQLATRGDGYVGQNITHNAPFIKGLPTKIPYKKKLVVRGEAVMGYREFERINSALPENSVRYKNPRNLANASIVMQDSREMRKREIWFHAFKLVYCEDDRDNKPVSFFAQLCLLRKWGFNVVEFTEAIVNGPSGIIPDLLQAMNEFSDRAEDYDFPVDGLVVAANDVDYAERQPGTGRHPNRLVGFALKWKDEVVTTVLRDIVWSASRTGLLNPVAVFDPVELEGTTVSRASLHNVSMIKKMRLRRGNQISVFKANKIIPQVNENLTMGDELTYAEAYPACCPVCGLESESRLTEGEGRLTEVAVCPNPECPAKMIKKFTHFASRDCMDIEGLSDAKIEKLVDQGIIREYADFFRLERFKDDIIQMEGFGQKSYENLLQAAATARKTSFVPFIHSLGIPNIGKGQAKILDKAFRGDVMEFFRAVINRRSFCIYDGIGEVQQDNLWTWGNEYLRFLIVPEAANQNREVENLIPYLSFEAYKEPMSSGLAGMTFVITGSLNKFSNRDELKALIEENGGKTSGSVSAKTSFLINNDVNSTSGKNKKAMEIGVKVISEDQFLDMITK